MSAYSTNKIFAESNVNALLDRLYYEVAEVLLAVNLDETLCLTGRAAAQLQGVDATPCENVVLLTNNADVFEFAGTSLSKKIGASRAVRFNERIIYYFDGLVLELWYQPGLLKIVTASGIRAQDKFEINEILL